MSRQYRYALAAITLTGLIFAENLFGRQANDAFMLLPGIDKVLHAVEYLVVFVCFHRLGAQAGLSPGKAALAASVAGLILAVVDEVIQRFVPGRNFEINDAVADCAGLALGFVLDVRPRVALAVPSTLGAVFAISLVTYHSHLMLRDYARALRYERQHQFGLARQYYQRALQAGMSSPTLYNELAWVEVESGIGNPQRAVEYASRAVAAQPGNPDFLDTYGWALHLAGRSNEALEPLARAYQRKPDMYCIHYHLGAVYLALSQNELAAQHLRRQIERPDTREAALALEVLRSMEQHQQVMSPDSR